MDIQVLGDPYSAVWIQNVEDISEEEDHQYSSNNSSSGSCWLKFLLHIEVELTMMDDESNLDDDDDNTHDHHEEPTIFLRQYERCIDDITSTTDLTNIFSQLDIPIEVQSLVINQILEQRYLLPITSIGSGRKLVHLEVLIRVVVDQLPDNNKEEPIYEDYLKKVIIKVEEKEGRSLSPQVCSICLDEFLVGCEVTSLPCSHLYHRDCIVKWLDKSLFCPFCRFQLPC